MQRTRVVNFTLTTNKGYVVTVAPSFAKAPNKKTYPHNNLLCVRYIHIYRER